MLITLNFSTATSLECFQCSSFSSMKDCIDFQKKTTCQKWQDRCYNMTVQVYVKLINENLTGYQRGCASQGECTHKRCTDHFAKKLGEKEAAYHFCHMSCCEGNLCPERNVTTNTQEPVKEARQSGSGVVKLTSFFVTACAFMYAFFL